MEDGDDLGRRVGWSRGPSSGATPHEWLTLNDDDLLQRIEALASDHDEDQALLAVIRSRRHFFIRQEAAKRILDHDLLRSHQEDRHIGQILVRRMTRKEDIAYLEHLVATSRYLEVRKAAEAQLLKVRDLHDEA